MAGMAGADAHFEPVGGIDRLDPRLDRLIASDAVVEKIADGLSWAEGPLWDASTGSLLFSDVPRNAIYRWRPGEGVTLAIPRSGYTGEAPFTGPEPGSNGLTFDRDGRLVLCQHGNRRIVRREPDGREIGVVLERAADGLVNGQLESCTARLRRCGYRRPDSDCKTQGN